MESCDLAYSIMETPFRRDVVKELCAAASPAQSENRAVFFSSGLVRCDFRPYCYLIYAPQQAWGRR